MEFLFMPLIGHNSVRDNDRLLGSRFERERTCPLCRALVKPADLRSYGDGSTSLFFQLF